jgi:hypothetical protein
MLQGSSRPTERDQLGGNPLESSEALRNGVSCNINQLLQCIAPTVLHRRSQVPIPRIQLLFLVGRWETYRCAPLSVKEITSATLIVAFLEKLVLTGIGRIIRLVGWNILRAVVGCMVTALGSNSSILVVKSEQLGGLS